eukprot:2086411-Pyramimonas_sp.AAC.1
MLDGIEPRAQAMHSFGDIKDRLYPTDLRSLNAIVSHHRNAFDEHAAWLFEGTIDESDYDYAVRRLQKSLLRELKALLSKVEFQEKVFCRKHKTMCCVSPRSDFAYSTCRWTEAGGN